MNSSHYKYIVFLGDNALVHSQRLMEWTSRAPNLEDDIAISNLSLDNLGRARSFYQHAAIINDHNQTEDQLAFLRTEREYTNYLIYELPIGDFGFTITRLLLTSVYEDLLFQNLSKSSDKILSGLSNKINKECKYHTRYATEWFKILSLGTNESRSRIIQSINLIWPYTQELFDDIQSDIFLIDKKIIISHQELRNQWHETIQNILSASSLQVPQIGYWHKGGRSGIHTEHLGHLLCELQYLQRSYPNAIW